MEPAPVWVPGQLYIGGVGLAKGYWKDEEKTATSFVQHPHTGERLYRTGDLGRYWPDGVIEFLGREDFQVKIQGHRIELGEIEATLALHPEVEMALATAITRPDGSKDLVAYVVTRQKLLSESQQSSPTESVTPEEGEAAPSQDTLQHLQMQFGQTGLRKDTDKPIISLKSTDLGAMQYQSRVSYRVFEQGSISFEQFSDFLSTLRQGEVAGLPKYLYPSAGGIYPVQTYLYIKPGRVDKLEEGIYYYHPVEHQLILLTAGASIPRECHYVHNRPVFDNSAFSMFFVGELAAISPIYKQASRDFCMLEAGYMGQLLMTSAPRYQLGVCPIGEVDYDMIAPLFDLGKEQIFLHCLEGGKIDPTFTTGWSFLDTSDHSDQVPEAEKMKKEIHEFLLQKLPEYMVPATVMLLSSFPMTPNGKIDRNNLPQPTSAKEQRQRDKHLAPTSEIEKQIAAIWQEALPGVEIGIHDTFFELGGNSLLMVRAYTKIRKLFEKDVSMSEAFFQYPTISKLVTHLKK
jgi:SagB-type dehydrogenase family enzyme